MEKSEEQNAIESTISKIIDLNGGERFDSIFVPENIFSLIKTRDGKIEGVSVRSTCFPYALVDLGEIKDSMILDFMDGKQESIYCPGRSSYFYGELAKILDNLKRFY